MAFKAVQDPDYSRNVTVVDNTGASVLAGDVTTAVGTDVAGANAYATVTTAPARVCSHVCIQLDPGFDAIVSLNSGTTDFLYVKANSVYMLDGLAIPASATLQGKNATAGSNYTNLRITVW